MFPSIVAWQESMRCPACSGASETQESDTYCGQADEDEAHNHKDGAAQHPFPTVPDQAHMTRAAAGLPARGPATEDKFGMSALHYAAMADDADGVELLIKGGNEHVDRVDKFQRTPLHIAAYTGSVSCCRVLLAANASMACRSIDGKSPLNCASEEGHTQVVELLLSATSNGPSSSPIGLDHARVTTRISTDRPASAAAAAPPSALLFPPATTSTRASISHDASWAQPQPHEASKGSRQAAATRAALALESDSDFELGRSRDGSFHYGEGKEGGTEGGRLEGGKGYAHGARSSSVSGSQTQHEYSRAPSATSFEASKMRESQASLPSYLSFADPKSVVGATEGGSGAAGAGGEGGRIGRGGGGAEQAGGGGHGGRSGGVDGAGDDRADDGSEGAGPPKAALYNNNKGAEETGVVRDRVVRDRPVSQFTVSETYPSGIHLSHHGGMSFCLSVCLSVRLSVCLRV